MRTMLDPKRTSELLDAVGDANRRFMGDYPGEPSGRQPLHVVYGGAHLFKAETAKKLGELARKALSANAPDGIVFARALGLRGAEGLPDARAEREALIARLAADPEGMKESAPAAWLAHTVYERTKKKLEVEPVEDFRIDFEDGYGNRPDDEEDRTAESAAREVARGNKAGTLPPFIGIRVKPLTEELKARSLRTTDIFVSTLLAETGGVIPPGFVITLPKVQIPEQVSAFVDALELLEDSLGLPRGALKMEIMIEVTQAILDREGRSNLPSLLRAARGRILGVHFGTYDYTASCLVTAEYQTMDHSVCDFAKHMMKVAYAGTGVFLSDGATNIMPVGPHVGELTPAQAADNRRVVHAAWRTSHAHIRHSLENGFYQGWDLHPAQLPVRYATCFAFFLEGFRAASTRLKNFVEQAARATLVGDVFDDAATGQGLLNYFLRALNSGAITKEEATATGLTIAEFETRSFVKILQGRRAQS